MGYQRLSDIAEDDPLLLLAQERIAGGSLKHTISFQAAMTELGISEAEIEAAEDVEIQ